MSANKSTTDGVSGSNRSKRIDDVDDNIKGQQQEQDPIKKLPSAVDVVVSHTSANTTKHLPVRTNQISPLETIKEEVELGGGELCTSKSERRANFSASFSTTNVSHHNSNSTLHHAPKSLSSLSKKPSFKAKQRTISKVRPITVSTLKVPNDNIKNISRKQVLESKARKLETNKLLPSSAAPSSNPRAKSKLTGTLNKSSTSAISTSISSTEAGIEISDSKNLSTQLRPSFYTYTQIPIRRNSSIRFSPAFPSRTAASLEGCATVKKTFLLMESNSNNGGNQDEAAPSNSSNNSAKKRKINEDNTSKTNEAAAAGPSTSTQANEEEDKDKDEDKDAKKKKNRCAECRKKVGLTGFECRCGGLFCAVHRYSDKHDCTFNYREHGAQEIRRNNPVVVGEKIQKI